MHRLLVAYRTRLLVGFVGTFGLLLPACPALAHVKWFCSYNVAATPRPLHVIANADYDHLVLLTLLILLVAGLLDGTPVGLAMLSSIDRVTRFLRDRTDVLIRAVLGGFFVALWAMGGIILTPELKTAADWVSWIQLAIAIGMIWRETLVLSALGIVALYAYAVDQYCVFHLLDYPIFLGLAAYLAMSGLRIRLFNLQALDVVCYATAVTLMWASVEKWAYPEWTFPLLAIHPEMTLGFNPEFYMRAAGLVEFALAFTLACGPLMRRVSSVMLIAMFVGAIFEFGKIDALGHSPIIVVLLAILADDRVAAKKPSAILAPAYFCASLGLTVLAYYGVHAISYLTPNG